MREALLVSVRCAPLSLKISQLSIEQPLQFGGGKIGVQHQARRFLDQWRMSCAAQGIASAGSAPILPDDRRRERLAGQAIPQHHGFALVRDADRHDVFAGHALRLQYFARHRELRCPYLVRIMLDPARLREVLGELLLRHAACLPGVIEQHGTRAGSPLVEGEDVLRHGWLVSRQRVAIQ